jgi:hypothetical protein
VNAFAVADDEVEFKPGPGWQWQGWSGALPLNPPIRGHKAGGKAWAVDSDVLALATKLIGKAYTASGFDASPGTVLTAMIELDAATLSRVVTLAGRPMALVTTTGKFRLAVSPAMNAVPSPDPSTLKAGTFAVKARADVAAQSA